MSQDEIPHAAIDYFVWVEEWDAERRAAIIASIQRQERRDPDVCPGAIPDMQPQ